MDTFPCLGLVKLLSSLPRLLTEARQVSWQQRLCEFLPLRCLSLGMEAGSAGIRGGKGIYEANTQML